MSPTPIRTRLGVVLVILALWLQALAPGAALRLAPPDPLAHAVICGHDAQGAAASEDGTPGPCAVCPFCTGLTTAPLLPAGPHLARATPWHAVVWATPPPAPSVRRPRPAGQPRAPPLPS